jgi:hypothetical protein
MKILIICSKKFYSNIPEIKNSLENMGHDVLLPNCYLDPGTEDRFRNLGIKEHADFKRKMFNQSENIISNIDSVLVLNFNKNGFENYIGGATFLVMYDAFRMNKKIYLYNDIPEGILKDEIIGFSPILIKGDLTKIL